MLGRWKVLLSNNKVIEEDTSRIDSWRLLIEKCKVENLTIKEFYIDNKAFENHTDAYLVFYEGTVLNIYDAENTTTYRKAIGHYIKKFNKARLNWFKLINNKFEEDIPEVIRPIPQHFYEISIYAEKKVSD